MNEKEIRDFLSENSESIKATVREKMIAGLLAEHRWDISDQITKIVNEFIATEIAPEVKSHLQSEKGAILEAAIKTTANLSDLIAEAMTKKAAENLKGYRFSAVMKAIFE
jgi:hypothetical protein